jgi:ribosome-binding factor A
MGGEIRRAVQAELARGLNDPRVQGMISITEVVVTPDLQEAKLMVSVLPEERASLTLSGLRAAAGFLRRKVMEETRIGRVPKIVFELDVRLKRQAALDSLIREGESKHASGSIEPASETDAQPEDSVEPTTNKQTRRGETNALENDSR